MAKRRRKGKAAKKGDGPPKRGGMKGRGGKQRGREEGRDKWLLLIAVFKLCKGLLLVAVGVGALSLIHKDAAAHVAGWISAIRVDPDNHYAHRALAKLSLVSDKQLEELSAGTFFYAGLLLTEGVGLWLHKHWAEYFTIFTTGALVPLELYELYEHFSATKVAVLLINVAVVIYLIARLRARAKTSR
jgi:uncharacterized membrane protein (DUF2068 family)